MLTSSRLRLSTVFGKLGLLGATTVVSACSPPFGGTSEDSEFLQRQVVPRVVSWAKGGAAELRLDPLVGARGYDEICVVGEYTSLDVLDREGVAELKRVRSDFGSYVPESNTALIGIRDGEAHVALVRRSEVFLPGNEKRPCVPAARAKLRRVVEPEPEPGSFYIPSAELDLD